MKRKLPTVTLSVDSRLENVPLVGLAVNKLCEYQGMNSQSCYNVELCAVEAVTNAVRHAYHEEPGHLVTLEVTLHPNRMVLTVKDEGRGLGKKPTLRPVQEAPEEAEDLAEGGWGLLFIHEFMDSVEYVQLEGGTSLVLTKFTSSELSGARPAERSYR